MTRIPIRIEGGLFAADLIERLDHAEDDGGRPQDFGLRPSDDLHAHIAAVFDEARMHWAAFKERCKRLAIQDTSPSEIRRATLDAWLVPLFSALGYAPTPNAPDSPISHRADENADAPPLHLVGANQPLDRVDSRLRRSPHAALQSALNQTDALWGIVSNGLALRLLRNSTSITRQAYVEFDLAAIFDEELFADFAHFFRLIHRSRLPRTAADAAGCWLERTYQDALQQGARVREKLRVGVEQALVVLGNALLRHPSNGALRDWVAREGAMALYRQLLTLIYRLLFLLVAEDRRLMGGDELYYRSYGVLRLRCLCEQHSAYTDDIDMWLSLRALWAILRDAALAAQMGLPPLTGTLFAPLTIDDAVVSNRDLLSAFWYLSLFDTPPRRINYAALDTEELGTVYESLLELQPQVVGDLSQASAVEFSFGQGTERRTTGSYYTPPALVAELVHATLKPTVEAILDGSSDLRAAERALLGLRVLDPACGSGHFLLAAARILGRALAQVRSGEDEPSPDQVRHAVRDAIRHCIYGVDKNPLAVELCKVALWIEGHESGKPLMFLDHRIRCGDSLVGVLDLAAIERSILDEAYEKVKEDDPAVIGTLKKENQCARSIQRLLSSSLGHGLGVLARQADALASLPDDTPKDVQRKAEQFNALESSAKKLREVCDLWTAAFFQPRSRSVSPEQRISGMVLFDFLTAGKETPAVIAATTLASKARFFHWKLAFPEVFATGGFDVVLANPPYGLYVSPAHRKFRKRAQGMDDYFNTAAMFFSNALEFWCKAGGTVGMVMPKSFLFSEKWRRHRERYQKFLSTVINCGQPWRQVKLEVIIVVSIAVLSGVSKLYVKTNLTGKQHVIDKETIKTIGTIIVDSDKSMSIIEKVALIGDNTCTLDSLVKARRGKGLQSLLRPRGDLEVIGGKNIRLFKIEGVAGYVDREQVSFEHLDIYRSVAVFQNIVSFSNNPRPHLILIGAVERRCRVYLDTVSILEGTHPEATPEFIVGVMTSKIMRWLLHRLSFGVAERTIHLDQWALARVKVPVSLLNCSKEITSLVSKESNTSVKFMNLVDEIIADKFGLDGEEMDFISSFFPPW